VGAGAVGAGAIGAADSGVVGIGNAGAGVAGMSPLRCLGRGMNGLISRGRIRRPGGIGVTPSGGGAVSSSVIDGVA
jgi:hypothetical protein